MNWYSIHGRASAIESISLSEARLHSLVIIVAEKKKMVELASELLNEKQNVFSGTLIHYDGDAYAEDALKTCMRDYPVMESRLKVPAILDLFHCISGLVTETGELMDVLKKHAIYGLDVDWTNVMEELGDLQWYVALGSAITKEKIGIGFTDLQKLNIAKLKDRYAGKFTEEEALNRDLARERQTLEGNGSEGKASDGQNTSH